MAANADSIKFDKPVAFYLENFLEFNVGSAVPGAIEGAQHLARHAPVVDPGGLAAISGVDPAQDQLVLGLDPGLVQTLRLTITPHAGGGAVFDAPIDWAGGTLVESTPRHCMMTTGYSSCAALIAVWSL